MFAFVYFLLFRVGTESPSKSASKIELNRRGIPARKRKKNSLIYGSDDLVSIPVKSPKKKLGSPSKSLRETPTKKSRETPSKNAATESFDSDSDDYNYDPDLSDLENDFDEDLQPNTPPPLPVTLSPKKSIEKSKTKRDVDEEVNNVNSLNARMLGYALRNLLKLPKAHKWVCFEFFYSNIDKVLFEGENDFMVCLRESFPNLKTRRLTRVEWCKVRRLMGKPRRCSEAFFNEERAELARKRKKIRYLQQRKIGDANSYKDLPEDIPMQLTIGNNQSEPSIILTDQSEPGVIITDHRMPGYGEAEGAARRAVHGGGGGCGHEQRHVQDHIRQGGPGHPLHPRLRGPLHGPPGPDAALLLP